MWFYEKSDMKGGWWPRLEKSKPLVQNGCVVKRAGGSISAPIRNLTKLPDAYLQADLDDIQRVFGGSPNKVTS